MKTPVISREVHAAAANHACVPKWIWPPGFGFPRHISRRLTKRLRAYGRVIRDAVHEPVLQLVVLEIPRLKTRPLLHQHHTESGACEFMCHYAAGGPGANDEEVDAFRIAVSERHGFASGSVKPG